MDIKKILQDNHLTLHVKDIFILENEDEARKDILPFFADGCPGVLFHQTKKGAFLLPKNKELSRFILYGQTIKPIEISIEGAYKVVIFQLFPSSAKDLFGVDPKTLNDDCYDLNLINSAPVAATIQDLLQIGQTAKQVEIIAKFLSVLISESSYYEQKIKSAINLILDTNGKITIKALTEQLHLTERTLQRHFVDYVGIPPKQFSKIVQFQCALGQISEEAFSKLTEIVFKNGYADQSHFIRSFKKFTGKNPSHFKTQK